MLTPLIQYYNMNRIAGLLPPQALLPLPYSPPAPPICAVTSTAFQWQLECLLMAVTELSGKEVLAEERGFRIQKSYNMAFCNSVL